MDDSIAIKDNQILQSNKDNGGGQHAAQLSWIMTSQLGSIKVIKEAFL